MFSLKKQIASTFLTFLLASSAMASTVAVIDSGTDLEHKDLAPVVWYNDVEVVSMAVGNDEDQNGYADDYNGWNFKDNNNVLLNRDLVSLYDDEIQKMFHFQYLYELYTNGINLFTQELIDWYQGIASDKEFMKRLGIYGQFSHGTHVAGIVAHDNPNVEVLVVKHLGDGSSVDLSSIAEIASAGQKAAAAQTEEAPQKSQLTKEVVEQLLRELEQMAAQSNDQQKKIADYLNSKNIRVANASYGSSLINVYNSFKMMLSSLNATEQEVAGLAKYFMQADRYYSDLALGQSPRTLFVAAAGNDGNNNDQMDVSPANSKLDNVITVAATMGRTGIASFSNYGIENVDVAAPGVGIESAAPGNNYVRMNGTSQAAPYVSRVASKIVDVNPLLTSAEIKQILMGTVDKKEFLKEKVASGGIVNEERAIYAAELTLRSSLRLAIELANDEILDVDEEQDYSSMQNGTKSFGPGTSLDGLKLELLRPKMPSKFTIK